MNSTGHPLISICIPAYKQPECLKILLNSIEIQSFTDFEVIITDDSPDDRLHNIIFNSSWSFPINYFKNPTALNSPENWNEAIGKASGTWIKIMHHDDWFENPNSLQNFYDATLKNTSAKFFFCSTIIFDAASNEKHSYQLNEAKYRKLKTHPAQLFHGNMIGAPSTTLFHKDAKMRYNTDLVWLVDVEYYIRMMRKWGIVSIEKALIITSSNRAHQLTSTLLNNKEVELREYFYCYNELFEQFNQENRAIFIQRILFLLQQFEVKSVEEIKASGYNGPIPTFVKLYCTLANISQNLANKILGKWIQLKLN